MHISALRRRAALASSAGYADWESALRATAHLTSGQAARTLGTTMKVIYLDRVGVGLQKKARPAFDPRIQPMIVTGLRQDGAAARV